jgi:hypothetical protein
MRTLSRALLLLLTVAAPSLARAQAAHANFSGSWVLDPAQSDGGQFVPTKMTQKITQTANQMIVERAMTNPMGETSASLTYALDGSSSVNDITMGPASAKVSTVVTWEGDSPVFSSVFNVQGTEVASKDKWLLSDGGKKLTVNRTVNIGGEDHASKLVLLKQ